MSEFYLVRHGQASFGKENYDQLSDLGHQQARWLGEYFAERDINFDCVITGEMVRHKETAQGILDGGKYSLPQEVHLGWNEFDFQSVVNTYLAAHPDETPPKDAPPAVFYRLLKRAMGKWSRDELNIDSLPESWSQFRGRVNDALQDVLARDANSPVLVVSSGGAMSMILSLVLGVDTNTLIELNLQTKNASFCHYYYNKNGAKLSAFNNVPHLDLPSRPGAVTYS